MLIKVNTACSLGNNLNYIYFEVKISVWVNISAGCPFFIFCEGGFGQKRAEFPVAVPEEPEDLKLRGGVVQHALPNQYSLSPNI